MPAARTARTTRSAAARKPAPKTEATVPAKPAADSKLAKPGKPPKLRRKPVRDSYTMPEIDFALIGTLKARALAAARETKKSELLRAGLHALASLSAPKLVAALNRLEPVKIGRPK